MTAPRIGVTWGAGRDASGEPFDTPEAYVRALERAGATTVLLANDAATLETQLEGLGGVVITGGQDVAPDRYGGRRLPSVQPSDDARDAFEACLVEAARDRKLPLLGICRGLQIANVALGGTLVEDIGTTYGGLALAHRRPGASDAERHGIDVSHVVTLEPGTRLASVLGVERLPTNTIHHQSAREIPSGLREAAMTADGVIEALEATFDHPFFILVQWHPELLEDDVVSARLFAAFVAAAL